MYNKDIERLGGVNMTEYVFHDGKFVAKENVDKVGDSDEDK